MTDLVLNDFQDSTGIKDRQALRRALRREMLARREAIPELEHQRLSLAICTHLDRLLPKPKGLTLGFCWPIRKEADPMGAVMSWRAQGGGTVLPVVVDADQALAFRDWNPDTPMETDRYGIPSPATGEWRQPDVLLIPVNAFDPSGFRLGYGGGFFDRTLAQLVPKPLCIGLGFECNRVDSIAPEQHDQPLDWIVTEAGAFNPQGARHTAAASPLPPSA